MPLRAALLVTLTLLLGGCGGEDPYCTSVENARESFDAFGEGLTDESMAGYASTLTSIAKQAPPSSQDVWESAAEATRAVVAAHEDIGFPIEDIDDATAREALSEGDIDELNAAYDAFNDTLDDREAIKADVEKVCGIELR